MTDQPCDGFPDDCPNQRTVEPEWRDGHLVHGGGIRCGCGDSTKRAGVIGPQELAGVSITAAAQQPAPLFSVGGNGTPKVTLHRDGRLEFSGDHNPDEAAQAFWDAVQRLTPDAMTQEFGAPLKERINAELAAGERAQKRLDAVHEAVVLWRDRPGANDIGLAISLASILDTERPDPPAATALVKVLRECDRIEREVHGQHDEDDDGMREAVRRIRQAAKSTNAGRPAAPPVRPAD